MPVSLTIRCLCDKCGSTAQYRLIHPESTSYKCGCKCHA